MEYNRFQKVVSYILKSIIIASAIVGILFSWIGGINRLIRGNRIFMYFTIQSNILMILICAIGFFYLKRNKVSTSWTLIKLAGTVSISLTGFVFYFVLAPRLGPAEAWTFQNILTHVVVPVASILDFLVIGIKARLKFKQVYCVLLPPLLYFVYSIWGYIQKWEFSPGKSYPYFFLNWDNRLGALGMSKDLPYLGCVWCLLIIFLFLLGIGIIYLCIIKFLRLLFGVK